MGGCCPWVIMPGQGKEASPDGGYTAAEAQMYDGLLTELTQSTASAHYWRWLDMMSEEVPMQDVLIV